TDEFSPAMNTARQPFVGLALMAALGIIVADFFPIVASRWWLAAIAFALLAILLFRWPNVTSTYFLVGAGFFLLHDFRTGDTAGLRLAMDLSERPRVVNAVGFAMSEPKVAPNGFATFLFKLESIEFEGKTRPTHATLLARWRGNPEFGDELKLFGITEPIEPPRNPGEFDMRSYLARQDVRRSLFVRYPEDGVLLKRGAGNPVLRAAQRSRAWMQSAICRGLDDSPPVQNFLSGIVLGLRHQTTEDIEEPFQQTGTLHLFAVAGLHVGIVARLLWILAMVARFSRKSATALIIPLLLFYAAITGLHVSSIRAAVMSSILLGGFFFERKVFALNSLAAAAFFLLSWDTNEFFSTGFQLSFAVVGGIILLADPLSGWLRPFGAPDSFLPRRLVGRLRRLIGIGYEWICRGGSVSLAAWLGSLPLIYWYFHLVTPSSLFANLVVVPIAFFILAIALLSLLVAPIASGVSLIFNNANWSLASAVIAFVQWFAQLPGSHYYVAEPHWPKKLRAKITVLDVGAGAAVHIHGPGAEWLFDCGSDRDYERVLRPYLHSAGVNRINGLFLTHGDSLHIGGTESLLHDLVPTVLIDNPAADRSTVHRRLREMFPGLRANLLNLKTGEDFHISFNVTGRILFPPADFTATTADDQALVVQLSVKDTKILFMSDSGDATEKSLIGSRVDLRSDILIKGQHHSGSSGSEDFFDAVQPRLVVATSRNFPQQERIPDEWARRVQAHGIKLFRQDDTGAVELEFGESEWQARSYLTGEIFCSANR
ncbi:MAG TPA: ComEC/Rec2 family competence protein, partial [Chthoniobacterales bacterium]|nr:ComEC/Rec2 family competence protein [Chthoniobacterales bacterium]